MTTSHKLNYIMHELSQMLLAIIDAIQKQTFLNVSSYDGSFKIQEKYNLEFLRKNTDRELSRLHIRYMEELGFPSKKYCLLYSREQVVEIMNYFHKFINIGKLVSKDLSLPFVIDFIVSQFKIRNIFDKNVKYLKTNEAVFFYDVLDLFGVVSEKPNKLDDGLELTNQEKYQKVKEFLRTIEKRHKID